jgi:hypothetical protein
MTRLNWSGLFMLLLLVPAGGLGLLLFGPVGMLGGLVLVLVAGPVLRNVRLETRSRIAELEDRVATLEDAVDNEAPTTSENDE